LPDFTAGELAIHFQNQEVTLGGRRVNLTPLEFKLLYHLVRNAGRVLPQRTLLARVWGENYDATPDYLKVYISRLRSKLERADGSQYIETVRSLGYRFVTPKGPTAPNVAVTPLCPCHCRCKRADRCRPRQRLPRCSASAWRRASNGPRCSAFRASVCWSSGQPA